MTRRTGSRSRQVTHALQRGERPAHAPGFGVDHIVPLIRGGADKPENMQWQTAEAAKAKDKIEQALQRAPARQPVGLRDCSVAGGLLGVAHALGNG